MTLLSMYSSIRPRRLPHAVLLVTLLAGGSAVLAGAKIKVRTQADKTFSFKSLRTWDWHADGAGVVKLMTTQADVAQSGQWHKTLDPIITAAVDKALAARGFVRTPGSPEIILNYYVLTQPGTSAQEIGQFLPSVAQYGLPPIPQATTALRAFEKGSLVLDITAPAQKTVVWRGIAETEVDRTIADAERKLRIERAVQEIVKKLPTK